MRAHLVVAVIYDNLCTFEFGCVTEVFALQRPEIERKWYEFKVCSIERRTVQAHGGIAVRASYGPEVLDRADTIIIPGWRQVDERPPEILLRKLQQAHKRGARICSICSGVFVLGHAGLLDGKKVTTHWRYASLLRQTFPDLQVDQDVLYIDEGQIITSAGSAAGLDMLLHLVRKDYGAKVGNKVAQRLVIPPHRDGGQAQYIPRLVSEESDANMAKVLDWIQKHLREPLTVDFIAKKFALGKRTLERHFRAQTGMSPQQWIIRQRVGYAKELLEEKSYSLSQIAESAGFGSNESFRRHFKLVTKLSPSVYRKQFAKKMFSK